jgi:hypothetical protein
MAPAGTVCEATVEEEGMEIPTDFLLGELLQRMGSWTPGEYW